MQTTYSLLATLIEEISAQTDVSIKELLYIRETEPANLLRQMELVGELKAYHKMFKIANKLAKGI